MKLLWLIGAILLPAAGYACPFCNSKSAREIRASLFGPDLPFNLLVTVLPFVIFYGIVYVIYHGGIKARKAGNIKKEQL